jgi:Protein of unknown function (DUF499)
MIPSIFDNCVPRAEILSGELSLDLFAAKLRLVVEGKAPAVYQQADEFFASTFPTDGIKALISEVFGRLTGKSVGSPVIRLETSFGGGKTHDEIALWHICKSGRNIQGLDRFTDLDLLPNKSIQVAAIDGRDLDPENGILYDQTGITTYTLWGEIAYQIGGVAGYELLQGSDKKGIAPGTDVIKRLMADQPTVIILDEIARYLSVAKAKQVGNSDLAKQVVAFLFSLMDLASACDNLVFVYSLAASSDTFAAETTELNELIKASARQERVLSPSTDVEIYNVVKQRLFTSVSNEAAKQVASEYLGAYRSSRGNLPDSCKDASYLQAIEQSYPFHPELFHLLTNKIAGIPEFQRTRGALRLLAQVLRFLWQEQPKNAYLIHVHHIPVGVDENITNDLTSRLQRSTMRPAIGADIYNPNGKQAYAKCQDEEYVAADRPPCATWVARTIFLHSLNQGSAAGIRRAELNLSLLTPGLETGFVDRAVENLAKVAWYLDDDPITTTARFREEPSINKIITEEKEQVGQTEAKDTLRSLRDSIFATKIFTLVAAPDSPGDVDDTPENIALCLIDFDEAKVSGFNDQLPTVVQEIYEKTGESGKFRVFKNRLLFLVADSQKLDHAIHKIREHKAIQNILSSQTRLEDLAESQQKQLRERAGIADLAVRIALTNTYSHLFYPAKDAVKAPHGLLHYALPPQDTGATKGGKSNQQEVILKVLRDCEKIRIPDQAKPFAPAYVLQKAWPQGLKYITTKALRDAFAKDAQLNILIGAEIDSLKETIRIGLESGAWDLQVEERLYIKTDEQALIVPLIELNDRMVLYRRGILQPPVPKEIELSAQRLSADNVRVRWKAKGALKISLYQGQEIIRDNFLPSDEYSTATGNNAVFRVEADYGNGEVLVKESAVLNGGCNRNTGGTGTVAGTNGKGVGTLQIIIPSEIDTDGTLNSAFHQFYDKCSDYKIQMIESLTIEVSQLTDYRKLGTAIPLLNRFALQIDQVVTIQSGKEFVRLEQQGSVDGFKSFFTTINSLLNSPDAQANVQLKIIFEFSSAVAPSGSELATIKQTLDRNPVERITLTAKVKSNNSPSYQELNN